MAARRCALVRPLRAAIFLYCVARSIAAEQTAPESDRIRAAMNTSIEKQRASVRLQLGSAQDVSAAGFFTVPWPAAATAPAPFSQAVCEPLSLAELTPLIETAATKHGLEARLVRAVIDKESGGRPCAVSPRGAQGLMQIMPATAADLKLGDPFDPKQNVDAGARYMKTLLDRFSGDLKLALGAYNAGPGAVDKEGKVPPNAETQDYVTQILQSLTESRAAPASSPGSAGTSAGTKAP